MSRADAGGKSIPKAPPKKAAPHKAPPLGSLSGTKATRSSKQTEDFQRKLQGLKPSQPTEQHSRTILSPKRRAAKEIRHQIVRASLKEAGIKKPTSKQVLAVSRHPAVQKELHKTIEKVQRNQQIASGAAVASKALTKATTFPKDRTIKVNVAGIKLPDAVVKVAHAAGATAVNVAKATVSDPIGQTGKDLKQLGQFALGAGGAVAGGAVAIGRDVGSQIPGVPGKKGQHPYSDAFLKKIKEGTVEHVNDYYGPLYRNEKGAAGKQLKKLKDEGSLLAAADLSVIGGGLSKAGKAARKTGLPKLTPKLEEFATRERTATVGASGDLKNLRPAGSITKGVRGAALDTARAKMGAKGVSDVAKGKLAEGTNATVASRVPGIKQAAQSKAGKRAVAKIAGRVGTMEHAAQDPISNAKKGVAAKLKKLSPKEQKAVAHAAEFGIRSTTPHPHAIIIQRIGEIRKERAAIEAKIAKLEAKGDTIHPSAKLELENNRLLLARADAASELSELQEMANLSDAELRADYFNKNVDAVADEYRVATERAAVSDPTLTSERATSAAVTHQGAAVDVLRERGETKAAWTARINKEIKKAQRAQSRAANELHHAGGSAGAQSLHVEGTEAARKAAERQGNPRARLKTERKVDKSPRVVAAEKDQAKADADYRRANKDKLSYSDLPTGRPSPNTYVDPERAAAILRADAERYEAVAEQGSLPPEVVDAPLAAAGQHGINVARARFDEASAQLAQLREIRAHPERAEGTVFERTKGESADEYAARIEVEATKRGLVKPSYSPSIANSQGSTVARPLMGGSVRGSRARKGDVNFRLGSRDRTPENLLKGPLQTIKTVANWHRDAEILAPTEMGGQVYSELNYIKDGKRETVKLNPEGMSKSEAEAALIKSGWAGEDSPFVATQIGHIRDARAKAGLANLAETTSPTRLLKDATEELGGSRRTPANDWVIMRKGAAEERAAIDAPVDKRTRVLEATQRAQTAPILGLSPTWALYQIPANIATTLLSDPSALLRIRQNRKLIKSLSPEERAVFDMWTGGSASGDYLKGSAFQQSHNEINLGKQVADRVLPVIQKGARDPFKLFQFDRWEVHKFRQNLLMNQVRKAASAAGDIQKIGDAAALPKLEDRVKAVVASKPQLEAAAAKLNEAMGDFVTMTKSERDWLRSNIMFYGYLRYSTRLLMYTLPIKHPLMAGILANLGELHKDEVEDLIGKGLPGAVGLVPLGNGNKTDFSRANPLANSLVSVASGQSPESLIGSLPPMLGAAYSVLSGRDAYRNKPLTYLDASGSAAKFNDDPNSFHTAERARVFISMMLKLASPVSTASKVAARGKLETSDSIPLLSPRYARVGDAKTQLNIEKSGKEGASSKEALLGYLVPGFPQPLASIEGASRGKEKAKADLADEVEKRRLKRAMDDKKPGARAAYLKYLREAGRKKREAARDERKELTSDDRKRLRELYRKGLK